MIELKDVSVGYKRKTVVKHVSFSLGKGAYGLLGPNGAGKTTLLRALAGVLPHQGTIAAGSSIGYLPQRFGIYRELRLDEAMQYFAILKKIPDSQQNEQIEACMAKANLTDHQDKRVGELSGGMLRRLGIAQALLGDPELLLVDEPTAGLDPEERVHFKEVLQDLKEERTVLLSTHIVEDISEICERVMIMDAGQIIQNSSESDLISALSGKIYRCSEEPEPGKDGCRMLKKEFIGGKRYWRVFSESAFAGEVLQPTLEDVYLVCVHHADLP